jgi:hypothetical protein
VEKVRRKYIVILGLAGLLTVVSSGLTADVAGQERIKDVDACGMVVDASGHGIAEATVAATSEGNVIATATSLSDGSFSFMQNFNSPVQLNVQARGFAPAGGTIEYMRAAGSRKCRHPVYAVMAVGGGSSYLTAKKNKLPRSK